MTCLRALAVLFFALLFAVPMTAQNWFQYDCDIDCPSPNPLPTPSPSSPPDLTFYAVVYEGIYPDIKNVYGNNTSGATYHYNNFGLPLEGRRGGIIFDPVYYLANNPDLVAAYGSTNYTAARDHFVKTGLPIEGRRGSLEFDVKYYLANNPDLVAAFGSTNYVAAAQHFINTGLPSEGRRGSADIDIKAYINNYPDIRASYGQFSDQYAQAMLHWLRRGKGQGRVAAGSPVNSSSDCTSATPPLIPGTSTPFSRI